MNVLQDIIITTTSECMFVLHNGTLTLIFLPPPPPPDRQDHSPEPAAGVLPGAGPARLRRLAVEEEEGEQRLPRPEVAALLVRAQRGVPLLVQQPTGR